MKVVVTGATGFLGKNLCLQLSARADIEVIPFTRVNSIGQLPGLVEAADCVVHLAGVNRPDDPAEFASGNTDLTVGLASALIDLAVHRGRRPPIIFTSSIQASLDNPYGRSKLAAEQALLEGYERHGLNLRIIRLQNVFGKWAKPNYNSVVATFCNNIARGLPINMPDASAELRLIYVDEVVNSIIGMLQGDFGTEVFCELKPDYMTTVGELAAVIRGFYDVKRTLSVARVGSGMTRALYATYVSYLPPESFAYEVPKYGDARGVFVEMLKTEDSGQVSYFTAAPGMTRGGHYHHTKTEKFLVLRGNARFRFRHMQTSEVHELLTSGDVPTVVETVPGWTHDITNVGTAELIVMLWANEVFDRTRPDTYACPV